MSTTLDRRHAIVSLAGMGTAGLISARPAAGKTTTNPEQAAPVTVSPSIVVTSTGAASAPANHAIAQVIIRAAYSMPLPPPLPGEAPALPIPEAQPATPGLPAGLAAAIVATLVDAGVDQTMILSSDGASGFGGGYFGPGSVVIVFQIDGEQMKTLPDVLTLATDQLTGSGVGFDPPGAMYLADTCQDLRAAAFQDAVDKAREEAMLLATAMGVEITGLVQARKSMVSYGPAAYSFSASDACADLVDLSTAMRSYLPPYDSTLPNEFTVYAMIEFTFSTT